MFSYYYFPDKYLLNVSVDWADRTDLTLTVSPESRVVAAQSSLAASQVFNWKLSHRRHSLVSQPRAAITNYDNY